MSGELFDKFFAKTHRAEIPRSTLRPKECSNGTRLASAMAPTPSNARRIASAAQARLTQAIFSTNYPAFRKRITKGTDVHKTWMPCAGAVGIAAGKRLCVDVDFRPQSTFKTRLLARQRSSHRHAAFVSVCGPFGIWREHRSSFPIPQGRRWKHLEARRRILHSGLAITSITLLIPIVATAFEG